MIRSIRCALACIIVFLSTAASAEQENVYAYWTEPNEAIWNIDIRFKVVNTSNSKFFAQTLDMRRGGGGYMGFQQFGDGKRVAIFSLWKDGLHGERPVKIWGHSNHCEGHSEMGGGIRCFVDYNWQTNRWYTLRVWRLRSKDWWDEWGAWVIDDRGNEKHIGTIKVNTKWRGEWTNLQTTQTFLEDFTDQARCDDPVFTRLRAKNLTYNAGQRTGEFDGHNGGSPCTDGGNATTSNGETTIYMY